MYIRLRLRFLKTDNRGSVRLTVFPKRPVNRTVTPLPMTARANQAQCFTNFGNCYSNYAQTASFSPNHLRQLLARPYGYKKDSRAIPKRDQEISLTSQSAELEIIIESFSSLEFL